MLNNCNQRDFASSWAGNLRMHLITHSGERQTNAINVTMSPQRFAGNLGSHLRTHDHHGLGASDLG